MLGAHRQRTAPALDRAEAVWGCAARGETAPIDNAPRGAAFPVTGLTRRRARAWREQHRRVVVSSSSAASFMAGEAASAVAGFPPEEAPTGDRVCLTCKAFSDPWQ